MRIRIDGYDLPGLSCPGGPGFPGYENIHVGVQRRNRRDELLGLCPGDAPQVSWTLDCEPTGRPDRFDLLGPQVQGGPGARFVYLSWVAGPAGEPALFRRAKLWLAAVPAEVLGAALDTGLLLGRLPLTDAKGHPLCARVVPPLISWTAPASAPDQQSS